MILESMLYEGNHTSATGEVIDQAPPPYLSDEYHKARKQYAFFSGLLIAWTLIGIEVAEDVRLIENVNLKLRTPDVFPLILFTMVLYFAYRTAIEWYQCDAKRRHLIASIIDFRVANALGVLSIGTLLVDRVKPLGDLLAPKTLSIVVVFIGLIYFCPMGAAMRHELRLWRINKSPSVLLPPPDLPFVGKLIALLLLTAQLSSFIAVLVLAIESFVKYDLGTKWAMYSITGLVCISIGSLLPAPVRELIRRPWVPEYLEPRAYEETEPL